MKANIARWKRAAVVIIGDLSLFTSLYLAHFIVWRTLRTRHKERMARLKNMRLINGSGHALVDNKLLMPVGLDEKGMLREALQGHSFRHRN